MNTHLPIIHEKIRFGNENALSGLLAYPDTDAPRAAALLCSPHPNFGGDMHNNVVSALGEQLARQGITLRFDYRGIGESRIELPAETDLLDFWDRIEETRDYTAPLADTADAFEVLARVAEGLPLFAVGYSFGAIMATILGMRDARVRAVAGISAPLTRVRFEHLFECRKPALLISGRDDFVFHPPTAEQLIARGGGRLLLETPQADHFFIGSEALVVDQIARFIQRHQ